MKRINDLGLAGWSAVFFLSVFASCGVQKDRWGQGRWRVGGYRSDKTLFLNLLDTNDERYSLEEKLKHNTKVFSMALMKKNGILIVPVGTFRINGGFHLRSSLFLCGISKNESIIEFMPENDEKYFIHIESPAKFSVSALTINNLGSKSYYDTKQNRYVPLTNLKANTTSIYIERASDVQITDCQFVGGHYGLEISNAKAKEKGAILVYHCIFQNQAASSIRIKNSQFIQIESNFFLNSGADGLKTNKGTANLVISKNISKMCGRDGYDFYDGLVKSIVSENIATENFFHGYDMKGNPDSVGNYVFHDNIFSDNLASNNGYYGFSLQNVRNITMNSNKALLNGKSGYLFNNVQDCNFNALSASKNREHGFLLKEISRSIFSNSIAVDNNYKRCYTEKNPNYSGFYFEAKADGLTINSCQAGNGISRNAKGNQVYGAYFDDGSVNNKFINCDFSNNIGGGEKGYGGAFHSQNIN